jgi:geranylgeranyl diphosphate synthase, type I
MIANYFNTEHNYITTNLINEAMLAACGCDLNENISEIINYHIGNSGGQTRAKISIAVAKSLRINSNDTLCSAAAVELLHNASLVHDDIQDKAEFRREKQSLWKKFGINSAICAGDLMISAAFSAVANVNNKVHVSAITQVMHRTVRETITGQFSDLSFNKGDDISFEQYESVAAGKSAPLIGLAIEIPLVIADHKNTSVLINSAVIPFAVAYQMYDDLADIEQDEKSGSLNIVNLYRKSNSLKSSIKQTSHRIDALINESEKNAMLLPEGSGDYLIKCSGKLRDTLSQVSYA